MRSRLPFKLLFLLLIFVVLPGRPASGSYSPDDPGPAASEAPRHLPLHFEVNEGQTDAQVLFLARGAGYALFLTDHEAVLSLKGADQKNLRLEILGANTGADIYGMEKMAGEVNYLTGNDPAGWRTKISTFAKVYYHDVYPGIDMMYYGIDGRRLEYDIILAPGADVERIRLRFSGMDRISIDDAGHLALALGDNTVHQFAPIAYQNINGVRRAVSSRYELLPGNQVAFRLEAYDPGHTLVIDPIIEYATFLGGTGNDQANDISVDGAGNVYVVGTTAALDYPVTAGAFQVVNGGNNDAFVSKLNTSGTALVYATYIGGSLHEAGNGIAVNGAGNAFVIGTTLSGDYPDVNAGAIQNALAGAYDAFVAKLSVDGSALEWSVFLGGAASSEFGNDITLDAAGQPYVTGRAGSPDFPTVNAYDAVMGGPGDAFVAKINDNVVPSLIYSTLLGGTSPDEGYGIAVDATGRAYVTGWTESNSSPFTGGPGFDTSYGGGKDVFVVRFNAAGNALDYATYLGGGDDEAGLGIAVDGSNNAYLTGYTASGTFPTTPGAFDTSHGDGGGTDDAFIAKLDDTGTALTFSTFLGGLGADVGSDIALDGALRAHVTGWTESANFQTVDAIQGASGGGRDAFVTTLSADGSTLPFSDYLGGSATDAGRGTALFGDDWFVAGVTNSGNLPTGTIVGGTLTSGAEVQSVKGTGDDAFVVKLSHSSDLEIAKSVDFTLPAVGQIISYTVTVTNNGPHDVATVTIEDVLPAGLVYSPMPAPTAGCIGVAGTITCTGGPVADGASIAFSYSAEVKALTIIENCVEITWPLSDPDDTNDRACLTIAPREQWQAFWQNTNQDAGTVMSFASTTSVPKTGALGTVFVGTDGGGIYRTIDDGNNWFPTTITDRNVRAMAMGLNQSIWVGTYAHGAYRSMDLLTTPPDHLFTFTGGEFDDVLSIAINTLPDRISTGDGDIFVGTDGGGIFLSTDDGATPFTDITGNLSGDADEIIMSIAIVEDGNVTHTEPRIFVGTRSHGVWYADYAAGPVFAVPGWTDANGGDVLHRTPVYALAVQGSGAATVLFAGTDRGVYRSADFGTTWTLVLDGIVNAWDLPVVVRSLLIYECGGHTYIMAGTEGDYVYRADLGAATFAVVNTDWTQFDGLMPVNNTATGLRSATVYSLHYADDVLYAGTLNEGVHTSTDCGEVWEQVSNISLQDGYRVIQSLLYNEIMDRLYGGTYGFGVIMSDDLGDPVLYWTGVNNGLTNPWVYALALNRIGGRDYMFAGTWGGGVFRSTNGGERWRFSGLPDRIVYDLDFDTNGVLFASTDLGEVYRSIDNGLSWLKIGVASTAIWALGIDPNNDHIYAGTFGAGVYKSVDGGLNWTQTGLTSGHIFDFAFGNNPETGVTGVFAATSTGVVFSSDGGTTWGDFSTGLTVVDTRAVAFAGNELLAGTWGGGAFLYDTASHAWIRDGMPGGQITTFAVNPTSGEVFAVSDGNGVFRKSFAKTATSNEGTDGDELPAGYLLEQNYPNPFNPRTTIQYGLPAPGEVRLTVYDAVGREVAVLVEGVVDAGVHQIDFDAGLLPSGVYFYRLDTPARTLNRTMILLK